MPGWACFPPVRASVGSGRPCSFHSKFLPAKKRNSLRQNIGSPARQKNPNPHRPDIQSPRQPRNHISPLQKPRSSPTENSKSPPQKNRHPPYQKSDPPGKQFEISPGTKFETPSGKKSPETPGAGGLPPGWQLGFQTGGGIFERAHHAAPHWPPLHIWAPHWPGLRTSTKQGPANGDGQK